MSTPNSFLGSLMPNALEIDGSNPSVVTSITGASINAEIANEIANPPTQGATLGQSKGVLGGVLGGGSPAPQMTLTLQGTVELPAGSAGNYLSVAVTNASGDTIAFSSRLIMPSDEANGSMPFSLGGSTGETDVTTLSVDLSVTADTGVGPKSGNAVPTLTTATIATFQIQ